MSRAAAEPTWVSKNQESHNGIQNQSQTETETKKENRIQDTFISKFYESNAMDRIRIDTYTTIDNLGDGGKERYQSTNLRLIDKPIDK